jgi:hypothetical protein
MHRPILRLIRPFYFRTNLRPADRFKPPLTALFAPFSGRLTQPCPG